ncbi:translation initiation factor IF-2 [bacterium]|nr:translation initiation factor IF-2 [bacterium]
MSKKRRVFHIARELNLSNEAVIEYLGPMDKSIRNQMSAVSEELYQSICDKYQQDTVTEAVPDLRQRIKERQMLEELRRNKARMELEERLKFATKLAEERPQKIKEAKKREADEKKKLEKALAEAKALVESKDEDIIKGKKKRDEVSREPAAVEEVISTEHEGAEDEPSVVDIISRAKKEIDKQKKIAGVEKEKKKEEAPETKKVKEAEAEKKPKAKGKKAKRGKGAEVETEVEIVGVAKTAEDDVTSDQAEAEVAPSAKTEEPGKEKPKKKGKRKKKAKISEEEIEESIRQTLAAMEEVKPRRRRRKSKDALDEEATETDVIQVSEFISAAELAQLLNVEATEVIKKSFELGMMVSINQRLDMDTIVAVADEFGYDVQIMQEYGSDIIEQTDQEEDDEADLEPRPPVVTIMGHVDHGKTSLLDYIRSSNIIAGEAGGITQHIGAYEVEIDKRHITFLDTPGHEAFTAMRARGAQATDLVVLIVAADDGVQPQTIEAINHATAASVPIVVAINKIDKPAANVDLVKKQLSENDILVEDWGGKYQSVEVSAKSGKGIDKLLELILLEADVLELKANPNRNARGVIIESKLDKGKGAIASVLVQYGTLSVGDLFVAGQYGGKVRAMYNERKQRVKAAPPSTPVQVVGFDGVPQAGDTFTVLQSEREVREISSKRQQLKREQDFRGKRRVTLDQISQQIRHGEVKELNLILKGDVDGSIEALSDAFMGLSNQEVAVNVIHKAVGGISESDVTFAAASEAIIIGFHIRPTLQARDLAEKEDVDIRLYNVIYDAVDDVKSALEGMLEPEVTEEITATIEVREIFKVPKIGTIAGCYVLSGKVLRNDLSKIFREDKLLNEARIGSLRRFKEDVREVQAGFECGIGLDGFDDIKVGDIIETYKEVKTARKL